MQRRSASFRNKLMLACALLAAAVLATPAAMAHDYYRGHRDDTGRILGALVVGAVIGGVIASASNHHDRYYDGGYYYPAQNYPPQAYYQGYPSYPAYSYGSGGYYGYPGYAHGGSVNVGVVYSNRGSYYRGHYRDRYYHDDGRYYRRSHGYHDGRGRYYRHHDH